MATQHIKKARIDTKVGDDIVELRAADVIRFHFSDCRDPVVPEFVHQNFGQSGKILWLQQFMPLAIDIHVDTKSGLECRVVLNHGGDQDSPIVAELSRSLVAKLATPCDLGEGCKPAIYPGDITGKRSTSSEPGMQPSASDNLADGFLIEKYSSCDFGGRPLDVWRRAEWLMLWYIESVSQSDHITDKFWDYYLLRDSNRSIVSMCSVYKFPSFMFLEQGFIGERMRLSQFLTIPTRRNGGHGSILLRYLADKVLSDEQVDLFTMEDPSFGMTSMRESVYLRLAKEDGFFDREDVSLDDLEHALKIPKVFAKRIRNLIEIDRIRQKRSASPEVVESVLRSGNQFVGKFIDSIEFFDDENGDDGEAVPMTESQRQDLIKAKVHEALKKLERVGA